jgi:hypothetical protein
VIVGVVVWATTGGSSGPTTLPSFTISVSQGSVASPDSIIESQPSLAKLIPAKLHYVPFEAGVTAIAEMKSGAVQAISGVGNPPLTEAIGSGTGVTVVMGWGFDDDQLLVPASVTSPAQLAGKSVGVLVGSSEDYELLGYLALQHLTGKVKVVPSARPSAGAAGGRWRWPGPACGSGRASWSACSGPRAAASRPCCGSLPGPCPPTKAPSRWGDRGGHPARRPGRGDGRQAAGNQRGH